MDAVRLRQRIVVLAWSPTLVTCSNDDPTTVSSPPIASPKTLASKAAVSSRDPSFGLKPSASSQRWRPTPGDPPYIDGYDPEEASCVSGNWCGTRVDAQAIAVHIDDPLGCPEHIAGRDDRQALLQRSIYAGLSSLPSMQGTLNQHGTQLARDKHADDNMCCYHWFEYCSGRPLLDHHQPQVAPASEHTDWLDDLSALGDPVPADSFITQRLADAWLADALAEHASIASFARAAQELMALGGPPRLLDGMLRAGQDEIDHARRCFTLASRFAARDLGPGPLRAISPRPTTWAHLMVDTFLEGCVGETIAALIAERAMGRTRDSDCLETLHVIATDESHHAALAWSTLRWAIQQGDPDAIPALQKAARLARRRIKSARTHQPTEATRIMARFGQLTESEKTQAAADAWRFIIDPMLHSLLTRPDQTQPLLDR